jgi:hypothetical protein
LTPNSKKPSSKTKENPAKKEIESYTWNPEKMLNKLMTCEVKPSDNWVEETLPKLVEDVIKNYETFGGMDHLEGKDLPSKKAVIDVLEDLLTVFFPGYLGKTEITKSNVKYVVGNILTSVYAKLNVEVEKSLKHICRKITGHSERAS